MMKENNPTTISDANYICIGVKKVNKPLICDRCGKTFYKTRYQNSYVVSRQGKIHKEFCSFNCKIKFCKENQKLLDKYS